MLLEDTGQVVGGRGTPHITRLRLPICSSATIKTEAVELLLMNIKQEKKQDEEQAREDESAERTKCRPDPIEGRLEALHDEVR